MKKGDKVLISPDVTGLMEWAKGIIIKVENNSFNGTVVSASTDPGGVIYFDKAKYFRLAN